MRSFRGAMAHFRSHVSKIGIQARTETVLAAANGAYECARFIERQRCDAPAEVIPNSVLLQELFNVRKIERGDLSSIFFDIFRYGADGLRAGEITHDRY